MMGAGEGRGVPEVMDEAGMQHVLAVAQALKAEGGLAPGAAVAPPQAIFGALHRIAERGYEPAVPFFASCLTDRDPDWRLQGLQNLGWHYMLPTGSPLLEQIRAMLETDPDADVRIAGASILGFQSDRAQAWPDWALLAAVQGDPVREVRIAAFQALVQAANIRGLNIRELDRRIESGELDPTWETAERLVAAPGEGGAPVSATEARLAGPEDQPSTSADRPGVEGQQQQPDG